MKYAYGTINGNASDAMLWAMGFAGIYDESIESMFKYLSASRIMRYKAFTVLTSPTSTFIEADYDSDWFDESSVYHAGSGIEIAAGLKQQTAGV